MKYSLASFALLTISTTAMAAKDTAYLDFAQTIDEGTAVSLNVAVGELRVDTCDCNEIKVEIKLTESDNWFASANLDKIKLSTSETDGKITLEIDEEDVVQDWRVTLPASSDLDVSMGVGEVDIEGFSQALYVDVGVGDISVYLENDVYDSIELDAGIGDTRIRGFTQVSSKREMISSSSSYQGSGNKDININVGIGDASVRF